MWCLRSRPKLRRSCRLCFATRGVLTALPGSWNLSPFIFLPNSCILAWMSIFCMLGIILIVCIYSIGIPPNFQASPPPAPKFQPAVTGRRSPGRTGGGPTRGASPEVRGAVTDQQLGGASDGVIPHLQRERNCRCEGPRHGWFVCLFGCCCCCCCRCCWELGVGSWDLFFVVNSCLDVSDTLFCVEGKSKAVMDSEVECHVTKSVLLNPVWSFEFVLVFSFCIFFVGVSIP